MKSYTEAYNYLLSISNLARKKHKTNRKECIEYLLRLKFFLDILGNPENKIPHYIHVTGTSGKGSTCIFLHSILRAHYPKQKIGLLTSPHLSVVTERWKVNDHSMPRQKFVQVIERINKAFTNYIRTSPYDPVSRTEMNTAIGLCYFAQEKVNWAVMEVACGGRYDSTNIIPHKEAAVITNIGIDHMPLIGKNKVQIAYEKAGITKTGTKVFTAEHCPRILNVIAEECRKEKAELCKIDAKDYKIISYQLSGISFVFENHTYSLNTFGIHQIENAILTIKIAESLGIPYEPIRKGLAKAILPLRMELVSEKPFIILDGAHNHDKIKSTVNTIQHLKRSGELDKELHLVVGFSNDKDIDGMVKQLAVLKPKTIACSRFQVNMFHRAANPRDIGSLFKKCLPSGKIELFLDSKDALAWSLKQAKKDSVILATGSIYFCGELRPLFDTSLDMS